MKSFRKIRILTFALCYLFIGKVFADVAFRGRVYSRIKGKGVPGLVVFLFDTKKGYKTDEEGYFDATVPTTGTYRFRLLLPTGMKEIRKAVTVDGELITLYSDKKKKPKGGLEVSGQKEKTILSRYKVRYDEIKRMPGTLGEALNALQTLPGVFAPPFAFGNLVIRGAAPDANTYLYNDLPILYAFHYDTINSVIHNDLLKSIDLYTGAYPANYANALGGVIEIEAADKPTRATGQFAASILLAQAMYRTPLFEGKGFLSAGGKIGYLDKTLGATSLIPDGLRLPQYTSSNVQFGYEFNEHHKVSFTSLTAQDSFVLNAPSRVENDPTKDSFAAIAGGNISASQGFRTLGLRHEWTPGTKFYNRFTLIYYDPFFDFNVGIGSIDAKTQARAPYLGLRQDAYWTPAKWLKIDFGTEARNIEYRVEGFTPRVIDPNNPSPNPYDTVNPAFTRDRIDQVSTTKYFNAYTTLHVKFGNLLFEPGVRHDYVEYSKQGVTGPRGVISYNFPKVLKGLKIFGGIGQYFRYPFTGGEISQFAGNPEIKFERALKYSGGIEQKFTKDWLIKIEGFKNEFSQLIEQEANISTPFGRNPNTNWERPQTYLLNQSLSSPYVYNRALTYGNSGDGWAHGIEVLIKKSNRPNSRDWYGWLSYTWSQTFRNNNVYDADYDPHNDLVLAANERRLRALFPNTQELIYQYDITHIVSLVYGWRIDKEWQVGGRWQYRTAYPYTPVTGDDGGQFQNPVNGQTFWNSQFSDNPYYNEYINSRRQIPYHRLDIRIDKFLNYEWGFVNFYIEIINVYIRRNILEEDYDTTRPFSRTNPSPQYDFYILQNGNFFIPFINTGMEVRF
ncbi:MAG: TonB-dependent receptor plug domain-containing protein [Spirochaetota bacterium]